MPSSQSYSLNTLVTTYQGQDPQGDTTEQQQAAQMEAMAVFVSNFPKLIPEVDDTGRIQRALDYAYSLITPININGGWNYVGATVWLEPIQYNISATLYTYEGITLKGQNRNNTLIKVTNPSTVTQSITNKYKSVVQGYQAIKIEEITFNQGGIYLLEAYKSYIKNVNIFNVGTDNGILTQLSVETVIEDVFINNCQTGIQLAGNAGGGPSTTNKLERVWLSHCGTGLNVSGTSNRIDTSYIKNSIIEYSTNNAIAIQGPTKAFTVEKIHFEQNSGNDIAIYDSNIDLNISDIYTDMTSGLRVVFYGGGNTGSTIANLHNVDMQVYVQPGFTGKIYCSGFTTNLGTLPSGAQVYNYPPQALKGTGNATIASGTTSIVVNHGLPAAPSIVVVTPQGNIGAVWVSTITASQFTINCATAPGSNTTVSWNANL